MNTENIKNLSVATNFQPKQETLLAVKSYLDTLENDNHPTFCSKNFDGISLVEVKNKRKSNIFPNEMSNTAVYHRLFKMFGGYFQGSSNGNIVTDDSYTLSFTTQVSRIVLMSQCHMSDGQTGLPPSFYKIIEEYCAQRNVNSFDYPFVISMLVASMKWNDPTFVKNLDVNIQTWFADRFKNDLKAFAKPVKKIKLRKKAA